MCGVPSASCTHIRSDASEANVRARVVTNTTIYPTAFRDEYPGKLLMGLFDDRGRYVEGTILSRRSGEMGIPMPREIRAELDSATPGGVAHEREAIYAGVLYFHYGHFLLESSARLWYAVEHPDLPII